jgi:hypothetical protein
VGRSESLIKPGDSSFSPKWLEGQPRTLDPAGVERRNSAGGLPAYPPKPNSEYRGVESGSQSAGEKLRAPEGNNPDRRPRPPRRRSVAKEVGSR